MRETQRGRDTRARIINMLTDCPRTSKQLRTALALSRDATNNHLKVLVAAGTIVRGEQVAKPPPNYPIEYAYILAADVKPIVKPYSVWDWLGNRGK